MEAKHKAFCFLVILSANAVCSELESTGTLSPPTDLQWSISGANVRLSWQHSLIDEPVNGYYVSVQVRSAMDQILAPDFVHVGQGEHETLLQGLWPNSVYKVKVVAFNNDRHSASDPVTVQTTGLELLVARDLNVSHVGTSRALFRWFHDARHTVHDTQFKLMCRGVRQYLDKANVLVEESDKLEHFVYASSNGMETYFTNKLKSNTRYHCHVTTIAETVESSPSTSVSFSTAYGRPLPPPKPRIVVNKNSSFTVHLYHSLQKFGPISHYKVFGVPTVRAPDPATGGHHFMPVVESPQLLSLSHLPGSEANEPVPFLVGTYSVQSLPAVIVFDGLKMRKSFKANTHYTFFVAVFSKAREDGERELYSVSAAADPPVFISRDLQEDWIHLHQPAATHFAIIVTCTLVSVLLLFSAAFLSICVSYYQGKRRDAIYFAIKDHDDSSEDEIYSKTKKGINKYSPSPPPREGPSLREIYPLVSYSPPPVFTPSPSPHQVDGGASVSPATVPTTSVHNNPLPGPVSINQVPVTMQDMHSYLAHRSGPSPATRAAVSPDHPLDTTLTPATGDSAGVSPQLSHSKSGEEFPAGGFTEEQYRQRRQSVRRQSVVVQQLRGMQRRDNAPAQLENIPDHDQH